MSCDLYNNDEVQDYFWFHNATAWMVGIYW